MMTIEKGMYHVELAQLSPDQIDPFSQQPWSPDQTKIIRTVGEEGDPIINAEMFIKYAQARITAALEIHGQGENQETLANLLPFVEEYFKEEDFEPFKKARQARTEIINKGNIEQASGEDKYVRFQAERAYQQAFQQVYAKNIQKLKKINLLLAHQIAPNESAEKVIKQINEKANELRALAARPIQENHYEAQGMQITSSHIPEGWVTFEQQAAHQRLYQRATGNDAPCGPFTNPSTIRDKRQIAQANAVRTEIQIEGKTVFVGHRHGSPSVLKINNEAKRQHETLKNVKQTMTLAARHQFAQLSDSEKKSILAGKTLPLNVSSLSLLSPVAKDDSVLGIPVDGMKQYRQVNDARLAYWSLQGRPVSLEVIDDQGHKRQIKVELNSTFMSMGVNAVRGVGTQAAKALVQRVNQRGINHFIDNFMQRSGVQNPTIRLIENNPVVAQYKNAVNSFDHIKLHGAYERLEVCNRILASTKKAKPSVIKELGKERQSLLKLIEKEEKKLDALYKKLAHARQKAYVAQLPLLKKQLANMEKGQLKTNQEHQKLRLFVDALDIYYHQPKSGLNRFLTVQSKNKEKNKIMKKAAKTENSNQASALLEKAEQIQKEIDSLNKSNYSFQSRFILLSQNMDSFVEWFCKSGEDRTGFLNEQIESFCIFIEKQGHPPRWDNQEDKKRLDDIMPQVHNGAPNRDTNALNDDSRGLKVTDKDFALPTLSYEMDKKMANLSANASKLYHYPLIKKVFQQLGIPSKEKVRQQQKEKEAKLLDNLSHRIEAHQAKKDPIIQIPTQFDTSLVTPSAPVIVKEEKVGPPSIVQLTHKNRL